MKEKYKKRCGKDVEVWTNQTAALVWPRVPYSNKRSVLLCFPHQRNDSWIYNEAYGEMIEDVFYSEQKKKWTLQSVLLSEEFFMNLVKPKKCVEQRERNTPA